MAVASHLRRYRRATYPGASREQRSNGVRGHRIRRHGALLGLAPGGVCRATPVTWGAGGLLHRRFTLTRVPHGTRAVCFLWHFPAGHPGWALPTTLLCGVRTFLCLRSDHPTDSSASSLAERPTGRGHRGFAPVGGAAVATPVAARGRLFRASGRGTPPCRPAGRRRPGWPGSAPPAPGRCPSPVPQPQDRRAVGRRSHPLCPPRAPSR